MNKALVGLLVLVVVLYGLFELFPLLAGPSIQVTSPGDGPAGPNNTLVIAGVAKHTETLLLNGSLLPIDAEGAFSKSLTLPSGGAILSLTATDRFGSQKTIRRSVFIAN